MQRFVELINVLEAKKAKSISQTLKIIGQDTYYNGENFCEKGSSGVKAVDRIIAGLPQGLFEPSEPPPEKRLADYYNRLEQQKAAQERRRAAAEAEV